jgi:hypothetical protein
LVDEGHQELEASLHRWMVVWRAAGLLPWELPMLGAPTIDSDLQDLATLLGDDHQQVAVDEKLDQELVVVPYHFADPQRLENLSCFLACGLDDRAKLSDGHVWNRCAELVGPVCCDGVGGRQPFEAGFCNWQRRLLVLTELLAMLQAVG